MVPGYTTRSTKRYLKLSTTFLPRIQSPSTNRSTRKLARHFTAFFTSDFPFETPARTANHSKILYSRDEAGVPREAFSHEGGRLRRKRANIDAPPKLPAPPPSAPFRCHLAGDGSVVATDGRVEASPPTGRCTRFHRTFRATSTFLCVPPSPSRSLRVSDPRR